jgi:hypothetical protein
MARVPESYETWFARQSSTIHRFFPSSREAIKREARE